MRPGKDVPYSKYALLRDAISNLTFNEQSFAVFATNNGLDIIDIESLDLKKIEPVFKSFLKEVLFPKLTLVEFEKEYQRLTSSYVQSILHEGGHVVSNGICKKILDDKRDSVTAFISKKATHNLTYNNGTFEILSTTSSFVFNHIDFDKYGKDDPVQITIPGSIVSSYRLQRNEQYFSFNTFTVDNELLNAIVFNKHTDMTKRLIDNAIDKIVDINAYVQSAYDGCKSYKEHLKRDLVKGLQKYDAVLASQLDSPFLTLNTATNNIDSTETGLDRLVKSPDMEEQIKNLPRPERIAIKKYKAITAIEKKMDSTPFAVDKAKAFAHGVHSNLALLRSSRDSYFVTFIKLVVSTLSFGTLAPTVFSTHADSFINHSFALFKFKRQSKSATPPGTPQPTILAKL